MRLYSAFCLVFSLLILTPTLARAEDPPLPGLFIQSLSASQEMDRGARTVVVTVGLNATGLRGKTISLEATVGEEGATLVITEKVSITGDRFLKTAVLRSPFGLLPVHSESLPVRVVVAARGITVGGMTRLPLRPPGREAVPAVRLDRAWVEPWTEGGSTVGLRICGSIRANGLRGRTVICSGWLRDLAGKPVPLTVREPVGMVVPGREFPFACGDPIRHDVAHWERFRLDVPLTAIRLPGGRSTLAAMFVAHCDGLQVAGTWHFIIDSGSAPENAPATPELLVESIRAGKIEEVRRCLEEGVEIDRARDGEARPALVLAALQGRREIAAVLLKAGAKPDAADPDGDTALHIAAMTGDAALVESLLAAGASPHRPDAEGLTPLDLATEPKVRKPLATAVAESPEVHRAKGTLEEFLGALARGDRSRMADCMVEWNRESIPPDPGVTGRPGKVLGMKFVHPNIYARVELPLSKPPPGDPGTAEFLFTLMSGERGQWFILGFRLNLRPGTFPIVRRQR